MYMLLEQAGARLQRGAAHLDHLCLRQSAGSPQADMRCRVLAGFLPAQILFLSIGSLMAPARLALCLILVLLWQGAVAGLFWRGIATRRCAHLAVSGLALLCWFGAWSLGARTPVELLFALPLCAFCLLGKRAGLGWLVALLLVSPLMNAMPMLTVSADLQRWQALLGAIVWLSAIAALGLYDFCNGLLNQRLQERCEKTAALATVDELTGLATRSALQRRLLEAMEHARRNGTLVGVVTIRLDNWPQLAAGASEQAVAAMLRECARRIQNALRQTDLAARAEPADFELILCNLKSRRGMEVVIRRLQLALNEPLSVAGGQRNVRATVGAAVFPYDAELSDDLFDTARADGEALRFRSPRALVQVSG